MHDIPLKEKFDVIFASNVLEHSVAPFIALSHWCDLLKDGGWLVLVMPSQEWLHEYYHFSVLTHSQTKDLLAKAGYELLAGPEIKPKISLPPGSDIFYDLGRGWGHHDGYVAKKVNLSKKGYIKGEHMSLPVKGNFVRALLKIPYNKVRVWFTRRHRE